MTQKEFLNDVAHRLYVNNTEISGLKYQPFDFIEAKRNEIQCPEKVFYENLIHAMAGDPMTPHFGPILRPEFFKDVLNYCNKKIDEVEKAQAAKQTDSDATTPLQAEAKPDIQKPNKVIKKRLRFIALRCVYIGKPLPRDASRKLQDHYGYYSSRANRTANEGTSAKLRNKITLFEAVAKELNGRAKRRINDEIKILKDYL